MSTSDHDRTDFAEARDGARRPYESPRIVWREPFEPVAFGGVSCARQPGNPGCLAGPVSA